MPREFRESGESRESNREREGEEEDYRKKMEEQYKAKHGGKGWHEIPHRKR